MVRMTLLLLLIVGAVGYSIVFAAAPGVPVEPKANPPAASSKVLRHVVMYKFKDACTPAQVQEVVDAFAALPGKIDAIAGFERGTNVSREGKSDGLTHAFVVTFRDEAGRDAYLKHPAHDEYVKVVKDKRERVVVFDYWTDAK